MYEAMLFSLKPIRRVDSRIFFNPVSLDASRSRVRVEIPIRFAASRAVIILSVLPIMARPSIAVAPSVALHGNMDDEKKAT